MNNQSATNPPPVLHAVKDEPPVQKALDALAMAQGHSHDLLTALGSRLGLALRPEESKDTTGDPAPIEESALHGALLSRIRNQVAVNHCLQDLIDRLTF